MINLHTRSGPKMAHELGIRDFRVLIMVAALSIASLLQVAMAAQYYVGSSTGWDFVPTPSFYSDWAAAINFFPGDQLGMSRIIRTYN